MNKNFKFYNLYINYKMNNENENNNCCSCIDDFDKWWDNNKYRYSNKLSILLGVLGGAGSALVGIKLFVPASIVLGLVNAGIFFAGISLSKFETQNRVLIDDNQSLKNELTKRKTLFDNFKFPISNNDKEEEMTEIQETPKTNITTPYEPVFQIK